MHRSALRASASNDVSGQKQKTVVYGIVSLSFKMLDMGSG